MGFVGIYKALYDYAPQAEGELEIQEGDLLYVIEKSTDDDWWKAKKKASAEDEDEPVGLVPNNYVEESPPVDRARALFEYTRQTDEELSFPEDAQLDIYDTSDPDWILAGHDGDFGFVPSNYIELAAENEGRVPPPPPALPTRIPSDEPSPPLPSRSAVQPPSEPSSPAAPAPAAALANVMAGRSASSSSSAPPPALLSLPPRRPHFADEEEQEEAKSPPLPARPRTGSEASVPQSSSSTVSRSPQADPYVTFDDIATERRREAPRPSQGAGSAAKLSPGSFHMYNINEMVSVMGKRKKMPTTLGINLKTGMILIAPERSQDGPTQEWTADRMTHYSREGKHVFMELVRPSKSVDFHAGAKDTAEEVVAALGELAGAARAEGLREVILAGSGQTQKKGVVLYDFMAQGDDEVTVAVDDEVVVVDDTKSEEWWLVRRVKNGKEGVVPSSYVEITGTVTPSPKEDNVHAGRSTVEQNRLEEARLTKEAIKAAQAAEQKERGSRGPEVGPGMRLPERGSSLLSARDRSNSEGQQRSRRESGGSKGRSKPDPSKVRTWTDRTKSFSVDAQFLGLKDAKIHLHKMNGVKIAVPVSKMSPSDLEYVERTTGLSLDEDKPLSDIRRKPGASSGAKITPPADPQPRKPDYDWFQFFLSCEVAVGLCERYAQAFARDSMDESVLPDVDASVLRNLGLREGDIIKVMRFLDIRYGRVKKSAAEDEDAGGLFSGPGGTLRNNTRKGRPTPPVQTNDVVDAQAFSGSNKDSTKSSPPPPSASGSKAQAGFEDDAWDVKPSKKPAAEDKTNSSSSSNGKTLSGSMNDLSLLAQPLEPTRAQPTPSQPPTMSLPASVTPPAAPAPAPQPQVPQPTGASPAFFTGMQPPAVGNQTTPQAMARQRPLAPQQTQGQGALMPPPPPSRPLSAPQSAQPSAFGPPPLQPQMTGSYTQQQQIAPPGQSLNDINQARMQQQYAQMQPQPTGAPMTAFPTGMQPQQQPFGQSPFADPRSQQFSPVQQQPTGFPGAFNPGQQQQQGIMPQPTGVNSFLPPALEPQRTGMPQPMQPQPTGMSFAQGFGNGPQQPQQQPLVPQQTGPPPPVRFGVSADAKKLMPQPTGRRANLSQATPQNPFGF